MPSKPISPPSELLAALEAQREILISKEEAFLDGSLINRLKIGLHCLKAHALFAVTSHADRGARKSSSRRDELSATTFESWLGDSAPWLKKPTAYKYMTALKGLSLDEKATEEQVEFTLDSLRASHASRNLPSPTLASLIAAATEAIAPPPPEPPKLEQQQFEFLKDSLSHFREQVESLCGIKDQLAANPDFMKAAQARAYSLLRELTGMDWAPSDEPDALSTVDPDSITL
jgi:hypothetical protein